MTWKYVFFLFLVAGYLVVTLRFGKYGSRSGGGAGPGVGSILFAAIVVGGAVHLFGAPGYAALIYVAAVFLLTFTRFCPAKLRSRIEKSNPVAQYGFERGWLWLDWLGPRS